MVIYIGIGLTALAVGLFAGYVIRKTVGQNRVNSAERRAETILAEARAKESDIVLKAKEASIKIIDEAKREEESRRKDLKEHQQRLEKREAIFDQKLIELQEKHQKLQDKATQIDQIKTEITQIKDEQLARLEQVAAMSRDEAKELLLQRVERDAKEDIIARAKKI